ncbi:hypothetical protein QQS21_010180 [Conoideocrella luteorostrata]|uniref:Uncharacterized protein n=1 Tax=Conoideocrella luteorostrata TaxID=1105319 RepID=A0AAJ0FUE9_9HYPO|nr:hypothetical protein QQS21_010180 [Conoideocrella luteorostrata]
MAGKHSLEDHDLVVTGNVYSPHDLETDVKTHRRDQHSSYQLHHDAASPMRTPVTRSDHELRQDLPIDSTKPTASHDLLADKKTYFANPHHGHSLGSDALADTASGVTPHDIHAHQPMTPEVAKPPHQLKDDGTTISKSRSTHILGSDTKIDSPSKGSSAKHSLEAHEATKVARK